MNPANHYYSKGQSIRFVMTTPEEESALFKWAKTGEPERGSFEHSRFGDLRTPGDAREFLIRNHLLFAMKFAVPLAKSRLPFNEVVSAANLAVVKAFESFNPAFGSRFTTYLRPFIFGEIQALWRSKFNSCGVPDPSLVGSRATSLVSTSSGDGDYSEGVQHGQCSLRKEVEYQEARYGSDDHPGEELDLRDFNREKLAEILKGLSPEDLQLVQAHYFEGKSFAELARERGITRKGVSIAHKRLLARLKKLLRSRVEEVL